MKNTVALGWDNRVVISQHIGDLESSKSLDLFEQTIEELQTLYCIRAESIVCDFHPHYASSRWAENNKLPTHKIYHHHAHASALVGEHAVLDKCIIFTWDGVGLGCDGTLWGGETFIGSPSDWRRVGTMKPFRLPGGDAVIREPWRCAASLCWESGHPFDDENDNISMLHQAWQQQLHCPVTSSVGRLFDGAAALTGLCIETTYDGQAAMQLEASAKYDVPTIELPIVNNDQGVAEIDWFPLVPMLQDESISAELRASQFHASLSNALLRLSIKIRDEFGVNTVGLTGGVFQNKTLTESCTRLLQQQGFDILLPQQVPCNDAGIAFGQIIEVASQLYKNC